MNTDEDDNESDDERYRVGGVSGVEALEKDYRSQDSAGGESNIVQWIDAKETRSVEVRIK